VKKVIELLEEARAFSNQPNIVQTCIQDILAILRNPQPLTPEQYRDIEGEEYPDDGAVYLRRHHTHMEFGAFKKWEVMSYKDALWYEKEYDASCIQIICAYNLKGPPASDWRPE
jgi:hypothetical protein